MKINGNYANDVWKIFIRSVVNYLNYNYCLIIIIIIIKNIVLQSTKKRKKIKYCNRVIYDETLYWKRKEKLKKNLKNAI